MNLGRTLTSTGATNVGDGILLVCWAWTASLLTRDPILIALAPFMVRLGWLVFAIFAGVIADRYNRRNLIIAADFCRFFLMFALFVYVFQVSPLPEPSNAWVSKTSLYILLLFAALIVGMLEVVRDNTMQTLVPSLVDTAVLEKANGRLWGIELVANSLIGPTLGGVLLLWSPYLPYCFAALLYAIGAFLMLGLVGDFSLEKRVSTWWYDISEAAQILYQHEFLLKLAAIAGMWNFFFHMVLTMMVLHVQENLHGSSFTYSAILASGAIGGIFGGWYGHLVVNKLGAARTAQIALLFSAPSFFAMAYAGNIWILALVYFLFNFSGLVWDTVSVSYRQRALPDAVRGRMNSLYRLISLGLIPLGILASGTAVKYSEIILGRNWAILVPFLASSVGIVILSLVTWSSLDKGFKSTKDPAKE